MRSLLLVAAFTVGGALNAHAQLPQAPMALSVSVTVAAPPGAMVTVEGCVTRESSSAQIAAGAREAAAATQFVLTQRTLPAPMVSGGRPSSGASSMGDQKFGRKLYVLIAQDGDSADFAEHLNHIVRVTGVAAEPKSTTNVPRLAVTAFALVSSTCR